MRRRGAVGVTALVACALGILAPAATIAETRTGSAASAERQRGTASTASTARPPRPLSTRDDLTRLQRRLRVDIPRLTGASVSRGASRPQARTLASAAREGYRLDTIELRDRNVVLRAIVAIPEGPGRRRATLLLPASAIDLVTEPGGDVDLRARDGEVVMVLEPRPAPRQADGPTSRSGSGSGSPVTTLGASIDDVLRAAAWLRNQRFVDRALTIHGAGAASLVALHAGVLLGDHAARLVLEDMPVSYRLASETPSRIAWPDVIVPGLPAAYDVGDLLIASFPQRVAIVTPVDGRGERMPGTTVAAILSHVFQSDRNLRTTNDNVARIAVLFLE